MVGHGITRTAAESYGRRRSGWAPDEIVERPRPVPEEVFLVRQRIRFFEERMRMRAAVGLPIPDIVVGRVVTSAVSPSADPRPGRCSPKRCRSRLSSDIHWAVDSLRGTPAAQSDEFDGSEEAPGVFVVSGGDPPELFDPVEEAFDRIALAINPGGEGEGALAVGPDRDVGPGLVLLCQGPNVVAVIALVGQQGRAVAQCALKQGFGLDAVVDLPRGQAQGNGAAFRSDERVDSAGEAPTGTSHAAIVESPSFPWPRAGERGHRSGRS